MENGQPVVQAELVVDAEEDGGPPQVKVQQPAGGGDGGPPPATNPPIDQQAAPQPPAADNLLARLTQALERLGRGLTELLSSYRSMTAPEMSSIFWTSSTRWLRLTTGIRPALYLSQGEPQK